MTTENCKNSDEVSFTPQQHTTNPPAHDQPLPQSQREFIHNPSKRAMRGCLGIPVKVSPCANTILKHLFTHAQEHPGELISSEVLVNKTHYNPGTIYNGIRELKRKLKQTCDTCILIENTKIDREDRGYRLLKHIACTIKQASGWLTLPQDTPDLV